MLDGALERLKTGRAAQLVTVVSDPGLGKTRLVGELGRLVDQASELIAWRVGHARPYDQDALGALVEIMKAQIGILDSDDPQTAAGKLQRAAEDVGAGQDGPVLESLRALVGADAQQPASRRHLLFDGWARFLAATADQRPLVMVVEDLQWADEVLLEFVEQLPDRVGAVPLLVVATGRPELLERRPGWGGGQRDTLTLSLAPLTRSGTGRLVDSLLGGTRLAESTRTALVAASGGNPLYVEEYVHALAAQPPPAGGGDLPLPTSVRQVIGVRIDALPTADKRLLQTAAVIGEVGWVGALAAVSGAEPATVQAGVGRLERAKLLRRVRVASVSGETEYAFRHALVCEVAYHQILRRERAAMHHHMITWLQQRPDPPIDLLAHHYHQAVHLARATGRPAATEVAGRARQVFAGAGDRAMLLGAFRRAVGHFRDALELSPTNHPTGAELLLRLGIARCYAEHAGREELQQARAAFADTGDISRVVQIDTLLGTLATLRGDDLAHPHLERARRAQPEITPENALAHAARAGELGFADRSAETLEASTRFLQQTAGLQIPAEEGMLLTLKGGSRVLLGDPGAEEEWRRGIELVQSTRHPLYATTWWGLAWYLWWAGLLGRCELAVVDARRACRDGALALDWLEFVNAALDYVAGRFDQVVATVEGLLARSTLQHGLVLPLGYTLRGRVRLGRGDLDGARADAQAAIKGTAMLTGRRLRQAAVALHCRVLLAAGDTDQAAAEADTLLADLHAAPADAHASPDLGVVLAELAYPPGALPDKLSPLSWHLAVGTLVGGDPDQAAHQYEALGSPADATDAWLRAAAGHAAAGRATAARAALAAAARFWQDAGASTYLQHAETLSRRLDSAPPANPQHPQGRSPGAQPARWHHRLTATRGLRHHRGARPA